MKSIIHILQEQVSQAVKALYGVDFNPQDVPVSTTRKEFEGDYTVVVFPFTKIAGKGPKPLPKTWVPIS
ncbi:MAG: hypothetical protein R2795_10155 [Saprospiraceae bacterium]